MIPEIERLADNFTRVIVGNVSYWFSYNTVIAFAKDGQRFVSENLWGSTTNKHINQIESDKKARISRSKFEELLKSC